jgi:hypothetical protein
LFWDACALWREDAADSQVDPKGYFHGSQELAASWHERLTARRR